ncbi:MAG TPA: PIN domain-containing protein [Rudaea sp.]|nr:PIN domain-containing protein [Rudaea sp.]
MNWSEAGAKLAQRGVAAKEIARELGTFGLDVVPFDETQANLAAALRPITRSLGLSLGDRCCLALAQHLKSRVITADATWKRLRGFEVVAVRRG